MPEVRPLAGPGCAPGWGFGAHAVHGVTRAAAHRQALPGASCDRAFGILQTQQEGNSWPHAVLATVGWVVLQQLLLLLLPQVAVVYTVRKEDEATRQGAGGR